MYGYSVQKGCIVLHPLQTRACLVKSTAKKHLTASVPGNNKILFGGTAATVLINLLTFSIIYLFASKGFAPDLKKVDYSVCNKGWDLTSPGLIQ